MDLRNFSSIRTPVCTSFESIDYTFIFGTDWHNTQMTFILPLALGILSEYGTEKLKIWRRSKTANQTASILMLLVRLKRIHDVFNLFYFILLSITIVFTFVAGNMIIADPWAGRLYELDLRTLKDKHLTSYYDNSPLHFVNVCSSSFSWCNRFTHFVSRMLLLVQIEQSILLKAHKTICSK